MFILFTQWKFRFISSVSVNAMMHIFWWHVCVCVCTFLLDMFLEAESLVVGCVWILLNSFPSGYSSLHSHQPCMGLPQWLSSKEFACSLGAAEEVGSIPGSRRSPGGGHGNPLQYSCLENAMDRGAWWSTIYRVTKNRTQLKQLNMQAATYETYSSSHLQ